MSNNLYSLCFASEVRSNDLRSVIIVTLLLQFSILLHTFAPYGFQQWEIGGSHDVDKSTTEHLFIYG